MKSLKDSINEGIVNEGFNAPKVISVLNEIKAVASDPRKGRNAIAEAFDGVMDPKNCEGWRVFTLKFCEWLLSVADDKDMFKMIINNWEESSGYEDILDEITDEYGNLDKYDPFPEVWPDIVYSLTKSHVNWDSIA